MKDFIDYVAGNDDSELAKVKAERDYALHCLERELAIAHQQENENGRLRSQLVCAMDMLGDVPGETLHDRLTRLIGWYMGFQVEMPKLKEQLVSARKALERASPIVSDRAAGGRMLTSKEEASEVFGLIQAAFIDDFRTEANASTSAPDLSDGSARRGPAAGDGQNVAAVGLPKGPATATNSHTSAMRKGE